MSYLRWRERSSTKWLILFWVLALVGVIGIFFNVGPDKQQGGGIIWLLPTLVFAITALAISIVQMFRR